jgi:hypothetical protein
VRLIKVAIWIATALFVGLLFWPLVSEMLVRLTPGNSAGMP